MPQASTPAQFRLRFLQALALPGATVAAVCREFGISRPTFYRWQKRRHQEGPTGLLDRSSAPRHQPQALPAEWREELVTLRQRHSAWGAKKLRHLLRRAHPRKADLPSLRTLERWLQEAALTQPRAPRARPGGKLPRPKLTPASAPNDVWTMDFKGHFRLGNGGRCDPLTVRDLATRFLLAITPVASLSDQHVRAVLRPLFRRWGLPRVIRVDNGVPFGNRESPLNLTSLSVWWRRLGILVNFIRPGQPQDNGGHEQMHRLLKAETLQPPAANVRAQRRAFRAWQKQYNELRPHEALDGRCPAQLYAPSPRPFRPPAALQYPKTWQVRRVRRQGAIRLQGRSRNIGRAFAGQSIGLKPINSQHVEVYLGSLLLGFLYFEDAGGIRPILYHPRPPRRRPAKTASVTQVVAGNCNAPRGGKV